MIKKKLGQIGEIVGGATPSTQDPALWGEDVAWITPKDLARHQGRFISRGERSLTHKGAASCSTTLLPQGSVLFSSRAPIGYIAIAGAPLCTNQGFKSIVPYENMDNLFVYYLMKYMAAAIAAQGIGTTFKEVSAKVLSEIEVDIPDTIEEQKAISGILSALDSKIELNSRINDHLEEYLEVEYSKLVEVGKRRIQLPKVIEILSGGTPKTSIAEYWRSGSVPFFAPGDAKGGVYAISTEKHITELGLHNCNSSLFPVNTVFLTARGTVGKVALAGVPMAMNQSCFALQGIAIPQSVVYQAVKNLVDQLRAKANGATFAAINTRDLRAEFVTLPSSEGVECYDRSSNPILKSMLERTRENCCLARLRDALLPKLMFGEIDISQVDLTQLNGHLSEN